MNAQKRYRNICFTLNNYSEEDFNTLLHHPLFKYCSIGKEIGEEATARLQGYAD
jgi:hypothetical protein